MTRADAGDDLLLGLLAAKPQAFGEVLRQRERFRLQILYTQIDRDAENRPHFTSHALGTPSDRYFYPASTVKLPAAILALEKLRRLGVDGLDRDSRIEIGAASGEQTAVSADLTAATGHPSIGHYVKKILLVSDNDAFNRLYEFLGQRALNERLWALGYGDTKLIRRLSLPSTPDESRHTNPFRFFDDDRLIYDQPAAANSERWTVEMAEVRQGRGYLKAGELIEQPIDFRHSNYYPLTDQQAVLRALLFPDSVEAERRFDLGDDDYAFLYRYLSMLPRESRDPAYDPTEYYDGYIKFFLFGDSREAISDQIRIFNKSGQAYGYLIDNAYVVDFDAGVEFLLSAVIQVNENEIYNDDRYEYDEIGFPFLAELGRTIYEFELERSRPHRPDLSRFEVDYP